MCVFVSTDFNVKINAFSFVFIGMELLLCSGVETAASQQEVDRHLELGKQFLVNGQLSDALTHYHAAVGEFCIIFALASRKNKS